MSTHKHAIALFLAFATVAAVIFGVIPQVSAGPLTPELLIKIHFDPTTESWALDKGDIDINDWPLSKDFIDRWAGAGSGVTLNEYAEIGKMEFDLNNQLWPTGGPNPSVRTGTRKVFFDATNPRHVAAWYFRRALAHLTNKAHYVTDFMKGQGYVMHTEIPFPALETYIDYSTLTNTTATTEYPGGYIYEYSQSKAIAALLKGGFKDWDGNDGGLLEWKDIGPDLISGTPDDGAVEELPPMKFWVRIDDPQRRQAGEDLAKEMDAVGIKKKPDGPLDVIVTERSACFLNVMVVYDYNIYTGGWSLSPDIDIEIFDLYHSSMSGFAYANNYAGFCNNQFDPLAALVKYPPSLEAAKTAAINAQWIKAKYQPVIELWAAKAVKGYRTGWEGVVNMAGFGVDNFWSLLNMNWTGGGTKNTIKYGFKSDVSMLHVICSEWLWDWLAIAASYDTLIGRNPYNLPEEVGALATDWATSTWDPPGDVSIATVATFTIRSGETFHDGNPVTTDDIRYGLLMQKAAQAGNAWNYPSVMDIDHIDITSNTVTVYFGVLSYWAVHWAGFMSVINKKLWQAAIGPGTTANYVENADPRYPGAFGNAAAIRAYHPWEHDVYDPTYPEGNYRRADGILDFKQDGSGPWIFESHVAGQTILFKRHAPFYSDIWVKGRRWWTHGGKQYDIKGTGKMVGIGTSVTDFFHERGNVNYPGGYGDNNVWYADDRKIDLTDLYLIANSLGTNTTGTTEDVSDTSLWPKAHWGSTLGKFNLDADVNLSYEVDSSDLGIAGLGFGKKMG